MTRSLCVLILLAGCAARPAEPIVRTVEVKVPVPVVREASAELRACGDDLPTPTFVPATNAQGEALVGLSQPEADKALQLIAGLDGCNRAWRAWAGQ